MTKEPLGAPSQEDAPIELVDYDACWPARFDAERAVLEAALAAWLVAAIEHIGSTAVPGLCAKPVIDIMAPVRSLEGARGAIAAAASVGYLHHPYKATVMHWFCKPSPTYRTHHLHLVAYGSAYWVKQLRFRDALRRSSDLAAEYGQLKLELAGRFRHDRDAYTAAKAPFIARVLSATDSGTA